MYRRHSFRVYQYSITVDGVTKNIERTSMIDFKATYRNYYKNGAQSVAIKYLGSYTWME